MTTLVRVEACCDDETEVKIEKYDNGELVDTTTILHGQMHETYVYDARQVIVKESSRNQEES